MKAFRILLTLVLLLVALLLVNTVRQSSRQPAASAPVTLAVDADAAAGRLAALLRIATISAGDDSAALTAQAAAMKAQWRQVYSTLTLQTFNQHAQLLTWPGSDSQLAPLLLLAHLDVVPAAQQDWQHPPFSGAIIDGVIHGRGAIDDKGSAAAILEAVAALVDQGYQPRRTLLIGFGHDEEVGGHQGAVAISQYLASQQIHPWMVLDEGGFVMSGLPMPVKQPVALVGIAEKGYLSVRLTAHGSGGHSSMPPADTAVYRLAAALERLHQHPFAGGLRGPTNTMFDWLSADMRWPEKVLFANRWLFAPLIEKVLAASPGGNAMLRTTVAPTMLDAGIKDNVLPETASAVINLRLHPRDSSDAALAQLRHIIDDQQVDIERLDGIDDEASPPSDTDNAAFATLASSIRSRFPDALVAPCLMVAATDSRHYRALSDHIYRFLPFRLANSELKQLHGANEGVSVAHYHEAVSFYATLITRSSDAGND